MKPMSGPTDTNDARPHRRIADFWDEFEVGLADLGRWDHRSRDLSSYPYEDEIDALASDWLNLGRDFRSAMRKIDALAQRQAETVRGAEANEQGTTKERRSADETANG